MEKKKHNKLIHSISPYLKQHAYNPVDWQEWNQSVFDQAEIENKLVLVSIGYSACHWCHVMAHESFEDEATAEIMNRFFICVKIDREELPDVDQIYMDACQLVNGNGGWPLNAFVLPDKRPIHAMTYAPKAEWQKILQAIHQLWNENRPAAFQYAEKLSHGIKNLSLPPILKTTEKKEGLSENVFQTFVLNFDEVYGGNNRAPKFPMPCNWRYLLEFSVLTHNKKAEDMALFTLNQMALGGIYDVLEGGFSRYSVDQKWFAPHFEKMLYDNAQLISLYSYAYAISKDDFFKTIALECIQFCQNEWKTKAHLYQSATDADSEGVEGLYYTYTYDELNTVLGTNTDLFCQYYQCTEAGNWEHDRNILFALDNRKSAAKTFNLSIEAFSVKIETCHKTLRTFRKNRIAPNIDYKCICSWNALMLKGISEAAFYLNEPKLILEAEQLADAILDNFYINQKLMRIHFDGESKIDAFIEDHATLIDGLIALYQCNLNESYLLIAESLCRHCINSFYHAEKGFFTFNSGQPLLTAKFDINDDVICSGNSIMAHNLWKLSWYFDCEEWRRMASNMSHSMQELVFQSGPWYSNWASLELILEFGTEQYILSSEKNLQKRLPFKKYQTLPNALFGFIEKQSQIPLFQGKQYQGKRLIFPCKDMICESPIEFE